METPIQKVLSRLKKVRRSGDGWTAQCPHHDDHHNSLSVSEGKDGRVLLKCHAGCSVEEITAAMGLKVRDLFPEKQDRRKETKTSITVADLARDKGLPEPFLLELGVEQKRGYVRITYFLEDGSLAPRQRKRTALKAKEGSFWEKGTGSLVPYGLWKLEEARKAGFLVLEEGESDWWTLSYHKSPSLGIPGADMAGTLKSSYLAGIPKVYVVKEPDKGGEIFIQGVFQRLNKIGFTGRAFVISMLDGAKDPNDLHKQDPDGFKAKWNAMLAQAEPLELTKEKEEGSEQKQKPTQAKTLVELAAGVELFHTANDKRYATVEVDSHKETWPIRSKGFREFLARRFYQREGKPPGSQAMQDAFLVLEAQAHFDGPEYAVFVRLAEVNGCIYLDLANEKWEAIEVTSTGWHVVSNPPVKFVRSGGMLPLPYPVPGGTWEELRRFVNVREEEDWRLLIGWMVGTLRPTGPKPILVFQGEQGSTKTTLGRMVRRILDPATAPLRSMPKEERDLMIAATHNWILAFDNMASLPVWFSDALCRLSTGGGFSTRKLYTDEEEEIFEAMRPAILTGIDEFVTRHDLADRTIILTLSPIPDEERIKEEEIWKQIDAIRGKVLAVLLDAVSAGLRNLPTLKLPRLPRMADFAFWVAAAEEKLPWKKGEFLTAYESNRQELIEKALESDLVACAVCALVEKQKEWAGTASELLEVLEKYAPVQALKSRNWPQSSRSFSNQLRRVATFLRAKRVEVQFYREGKKGQRLIKLEKR